MRFRGIQARSLLLLLAGAALFTAVAGTIAYRVDYGKRLATAGSTIQELVTAVEKTAAVGAFTRDPLLLKEVIAGLAATPLVLSVEVVDAQGTRLARVDRPGPAVLPEQGASLERALVSPFDSRERIGRLVIEPDMAQMRYTAQREAWQLVGLLVLQVVFIATLLSVTTTRLVSRPIVRLAGALRGMSPGTSQRLEVPEGHAHDEIGVLTHSANALLQANEETLERERRLRADVERMEAQYRHIFDSTSAGIFLVDRDGRLINGNPTVLRVMGTSLADIQQLRGEDFLRAAFDDPDQVREMIRRAATQGKTVSGDLRLLDASATGRWVHCLISVLGEYDARASGSAGLVEGVMYDITERVHAEHRTRHEAEHDALTGLKNRAASEAAIDRVLAEAAAGGCPATLMYIDLDGFKQVNDQFGHQAGDLLLRQCGERMRRLLRRSSDVVGRLGGDEFMLVLPQAGTDDLHASEVAAGIVASLAEPVVLPDGREARVGASVGMACYPHHGRTRGELEACADEALYAVKRGGRRSFAMALGVRRQGAGSWRGSDLTLHASEAAPEPGRRGTRPGRGNTAAGSEGDAIQWTGRRQSGASTVAVCIHDIGSGRMHSSRGFHGAQPGGLQRFRIRLPAVPAGDHFVRKDLPRFVAPVHLHDDHGRGVLGSPR
jgi:diguanylate cyclase (GGDEF)-like protein/PAS domain S-box-containing protein